MNVNLVSTQDNLLLSNLLDFYNNDDNLSKMLKIITGDSVISLRIVDWFATNFAKKNFTTYEIDEKCKRFNVYSDYKLKLKAYSKKRFDPFCRWERICIPYREGKSIETTIGQLNFFKWAIEKKVIDFILNNLSIIENDMNGRNSTSKRKTNVQVESQKTRKKREELSISAAKSIKKEEVQISIEFN